MDGIKAVFSNWSTLAVMCCHWDGRQAGLILEELHGG